jgi:hypothetical protein
MVAADGAVKGLAGVGAVVDLNSGLAAVTDADSSVRVRWPDSETTACGAYGWATCRGTTSGICLQSASVVQPWGAASLALRFRPRPLAAGSRSTAGLGWRRAERRRADRRGRLDPSISPSPPGAHASMLRRERADVMVVPVLLADLQPGQRRPLSAPAADVGKRGRSCRPNFLPVRSDRGVTFRRRSAPGRAGSRR